MTALGPAWAVGRASGAEIDVSGARAGLARLQRRELASRTLRAASSWTRAASSGMRSAARTSRVLSDAVSWTSLLPEAANTVDAQALLDYFDRVVVINLRRRPERMSQFMAAQARWPFRPAIRFEAVDGRATGHPKWWLQGNGAWGCLMSHARVIESALCDGIKSLLVFEDDATFVEHFDLRVAQFLSMVPSDWDSILLGGQHLRSPFPVNSRVCRVRNGNRTHAYALRGEFLGTVYRHILNAPDYEANERHHVDHRLGALHELGEHNVYAPTDWLVGQCQGPSDIGRDSGERFWTDVRAMPKGEAIGGDVCLFSTYLDPTPVTDVVRQYAATRGWSFDLFVRWHSWKNTGDRLAAIRRARLVLVWDGQEPGNDWVRRICLRHGVPLLYLQWSSLLERGVQIDPEGFCGRSSLSGSLDWVNDEDMRRLEMFQQETLQGLALPQPEPAGSQDLPILALLQREHESGIIFDSRWKRMSEFVLHVEEQYPESAVILSPDAHDIHPVLDCRRARLDATTDYRTLARRSRLVIGLNSQRLMTAAALGVPTVALGGCPLRRHAGDVGRVLAAQLSRESPFDVRSFARCVDRLLPQFAVQDARHAEQSAHDAPELGVGHASDVRV